jgi:hypothetical protein
MTEQDDHKQPIGTGYPMFQLAKALQNKSGILSQDGKVGKWLQLIKDMMAGVIEVGSRTPHRDYPAWVTLDVMTGGFATGTPLSAGPLRSHEKELLAELGLPEAHRTRQALNLYFVSEEGLKRLYEWLDNRQYQLQVPEEGALLTVAALLQQSKHSAASQLLSALVPYFDRLRFYPVPTDQPAVVDDARQLHVKTVGQVVEQLRQARPNHNIIAQYDSVMVWTPFYDRMMALLIQACEQSKGSVDAEFKAFGPIDDDWISRKNALLNSYKKLLQQHRLSKRWSRKGAQFARLIGFLQGFRVDQVYLAKHRNYVTQAVNRFVARHGIPGSVAHRQAREKQQQQCAEPLHSQARKVLIHRLSLLNQATGIEQIEAAVSAVSHQEADEFALPEGWSIPEYIIGKVLRAKMDSIAGLVASGVITSADMMAILVPQISAQAMGSSIADEGIRCLYQKLYQAFRQRRSLLLMNYASQVRLNEIPWIKAIDVFRVSGDDSNKHIKQVLLELLSQAIRHFPHAIIPNKLLQEVVALANQSGLDLPLTEELAADIFMGAFSAKFAKVACLAAGQLQGTLYQRYYRINCAEVMSTCSPDGVTFNQKHGRQLARICQARTGQESTGYSVAANGMVIEQQQIITTHNLAQLFSLFDDSNALKLSAAELAGNCFVWLTRRFKINRQDHHANLIMIKNMAYAWRQMVFFLSVLSEQEQLEVLQQMQQQLSKLPALVQVVFHPLLDKLLSLVASEQFNEGYVFTGWSIRKHPLLDAAQSIDG